MGDLNGTKIGVIHSLLENSAWHSQDKKHPYLLAPVDLQAVKACGVTFAQSMLERVIEERARGRRIGWYVEHPIVFQHGKGRFAYRKNPPSVGSHMQTSPCWKSGHSNTARAQGARAYGDGGHVNRPAVLTGSHVHAGRSEGTSNPQRSTGDAPISWIGQ